MAATFSGLPTWDLLVGPFDHYFSTSEVAVNAAGRSIVRILVHGKTVHDDVTVVTANALGPLRARFFGLPGAAPGAIALINEQLQALLVGHGHPTGTVKAQANSLIDKFGHKRCRQILESKACKAAWPTLKHEASAAGIVLIPSDSRSSKEIKRDLVFDEDPWARYNSPGGNKEKTVETKRRPRKQGQAARVDLSFFHAGQQSLPQVDFAQLLQGWSGVHVVRFEDFADLDTVTNANLCACASAVLVVGAAGESISERFPDKAESMLVPGWLQNHPVALRCTLIQTGDEKVETRSTSVLTFQEAVSTQAVVQVYVHKNEASEKWAVLANEGISTYLKQLGFTLDAITQTWSQAFFRRGKKVPAAESEYFRGFIKIEKGKLDALLKLGGMAGFYPAPRSPEKGPDPRFRSILLRGHTLQEARSVQASLPNSIGLTRSKHGIGVRVLATEYKALKKKVFPQAAESSESDEGGARRFQLLGVPDDCTRSTLKQASKALQWPVKVLRSAGIRAWTVTSSSPPPTRSFPLRQAVVLVLEQEYRNTHDVVATTARKLQTNLPKIAPSVPQPSSSSQSAGPAKFEQLESRVAELAEQVVKTQTDTAASIAEVQTVVQAIDEKVNSQEIKMDTKIETMFNKLLQNQQSCFGQLEKTNAKVISELRTEYVAGYSELKDILSNSPKARRLAEVSP